MSETPIGDAITQDHAPVVESVEIVATQPVEPAVKSTDLTGQHVTLLDGQAGTVVETHGLMILLDQDGEQTWQHRENVVDAATA